MIEPFELTVFPISATDVVSPVSWQADTVYQAILVATSVMIGHITTVLCFLFVTMSEILATLLHERGDDIWATEERRSDGVAAPDGQSVNEDAGQVGRQYM